MSGYREGYSYVTTMKLLLAFDLKDEVIVKRKKKATRMSSLFNPRWIR